MKCANFLIAIDVAVCGWLILGPFYHHSSKEFPPYVIHFRCELLQSLRFCTVTSIPMYNLFTLISMYWEFAHKQFWNEFFFFTCFTEIRISDRSKIIVPLLWIAFYKFPNVKTLNAKNNENAHIKLLFLCRTYNFQS